MGKITQSHLFIIFLLLPFFVLAQDMTNPVAVCMDMTFQLDASGSVTISGADVDGGSTDDTGVDSLTVSPDTFSCTDIGTPVSVTLTVLDAAGNMDTCMAIVTIADMTPPTAMCQNIMVPLDAMGMATITADMLDNGSTDNCGLPLSFSASQTTFTCADTAGIMVTLTVTDSSGNASSCMAMVTVEDNTPPSIVCQDATVQLDATGNITIDPAIFDNGSADSCGAVTFSASQTMFSCVDVLNPPETDLVLSGIVSGRYVDEMMDPTPDVITTYEIIELYTVQAIADLSIYSIGVANDGGGSNGSEFTFPAISVAADTHFTVASETTNATLFLGSAPTHVTSTLDIDGDDAVELFMSGVVIDVYGDQNIDGTDEDWDYTRGWGYRISNTAANVSFQSGDWFYSTPGALQDQETNMGALVPFPQNNYEQVLGGVSDPVAVTFTVTDANGNMDSCVVNLTIEDVTPPTSIPQDLTLQLNVNGEAFLVIEDMDPGTVDFDNGSSDTCGLASRVADPSAFFCDDIGTNTVTLTVTDTFGNVTANTATVTVEDNIAPTMVCAAITAQLDATGSVTITPFQVGGGSSDICGIAMATLDIDTFTCANIGANMVTYTATDVNGNVDSCTAMVTIEDMAAPLVVCQAFTLQLDAMGMATLNAIDVDGGSSDACGIATRSVDISTFDCSNLGVNDVVLTVTDVNGNSATCTAVVTIEDMVNPVAIAMDITVGINTSGSTTIFGADINNGSTDNCAVMTYSVSPDTFTCSDVGAPVPVVLTVTDASGNTDTATANITVVDNVPPSVVCQNITIPLDATGNASITFADVDGGSSVSCGSLTASIDISSFDCTNLGPNNVQLTVVNSNNVSRTCTAVVTIVDAAPPMVVCQDITVILDGTGAATITAADIDNGSSDNCGIATTSINTSSFSCADVGANTVVLTVTDVNGNSNTCSAVVTVLDDVDPIVACQNITLQLDAAGNASIVAMDVDAGSTDFCGIASRSIDISTFDCSDIGANTVVLTVTDTSGNTAMCNAIVTVEDSLGPDVVCQNITVQLDTTGTATIVAADIDNGSTDVCGISTIDVDIALFTCANIGSNNVNLTVTDVNGNSSTCSAIVTVEDSIAPTVSCQDITVQLDVSGNANITVFDIDGGSTDACGISTSSIDISSFGCDDLGINSVTLTVTDLNGNSSTCIANVTVQDVEDPIIDCPGNLTETIIPGTLYTVPDFIADGVVTANDNCTTVLTTVTQTPTIGSQLAVGTYSASMTIEDASGNEESCVFTLIVSDTALNIQGVPSFSSLKLYPNPTASILVLENTQLLKVNEINFYDLSGRLVKTIRVNALEQQMEMDISTLSTASYMVEIVGSEGRIIKQIIKE